jgi:3-polyprenyl-4-hydroxybenzoate decarboxylase
MHIQIHRGGGNHFALAEQQELALPAAVYVGGPPALTLAAVAPLPEDVPELVFASLLMGEKLPLIQTPQAPFPLIADADFCLFGTMPPQVREPEGPFGDHYGYYSLKHDYPILKIDHIWHRKDAVWAATVVGRPPQEDHFIALFLQDVLSPLFPLVMKGVVDVFAYEESGVHSLAGAVVKERYGKEALTLALRILGEGQLSLSKNLLVTDGEVNPREFPSFLQHILERCDFRTDLHVLCHTSYDTLDYTSGTINLGSKAIFLGTGRERRFSLQSDLPNPSHWERFSASAMFIPGVVVVEGPSFQEEPKALDLLQQWPQLQHYRWIVLTDRGEGHACANSSSDFLWRVFTRFHPQQDLQGKRIQEGFHVGIAGPLFMDCRMKPWYPGLLIPDPETVEEVDALWDRLNLS